MTRLMAPNKLRAYTLYWTGGTVVCQDCADHHGVTTGVTIDGYRLEEVTDVDVREFHAMTAAFNDGKPRPLVCRGRHLRAVLTYDGMEIIEIVRGRR